MVQYILRRLLTLPLIMFLVSVIVFILVLQIPAEERVTAYLPSVRSNLSTEQYEKLLQTTIERYGLDQPPIVQYTRWVGKLLQGDWGYSPSWRQPVLEGLLQRTPATIELLLFAMIPSIIMAIVLGRLSVHRQGRTVDALLRASTFVGWSFPPFILALILMNTFYAWLGWFPPERMSSWAGEVVRSEGFHNITGLLTVDALLNLNPPVFVDALRHLALPGFTLAFAIWALLTRIMRSSLLEVMGQEYITTARSKGLDERNVVSHHAVRNAVLPLISTGATISASMITTVAVVEMVFNYNGIGRWAVRSFLLTEVPVTVGFALFACTLTVLSSLIADVLYAWVDPRVRIFAANGSEAE
jgi:peptide/nickel transport system permease protein